MCLWFLRTVILLLKVVEENFPGKNHFLLASLDLSKQRTSLKSKLASTCILLTNNLIKNFNGCLKLTENGPTGPTKVFSACTTYEKQLRIEKTRLSHQVWSHGGSTFLKKKRTLNGHFSRPTETDPYAVAFYVDWYAHISMKPHRKIRIVYADRLICGYPHMHKNAYPVIYEQPLITKIISMGN